MGATELVNCHYVKLHWPIFNFWSFFFFFLHFELTVEHTTWNPARQHAWWFPASLVQQYVISKISKLASLLTYGLIWPFKLSHRQWCISRYKTRFFKRILANSNDFRLICEESSEAHQTERHKIGHYPWHSTDLIRTVISSQSWYKKFKCYLTRNFIGFNYSTLHMQICQSKLGIVHWYLKRQTWVSYVLKSKQKQNK